MGSFGNENEGGCIGNATAKHNYRNEKWGVIMKFKFVVGAVLTILAAPSLATDMMVHSNAALSAATAPAGATLKAATEESRSEACKNAVEQTTADLSGNWVRLRSGCQSLFGGFSVTQAPGAQITNVNFLNYHLKLGDNVSVPFQIFGSPSIAGSTGQTSVASANQAKLLDPTTGFAIRVPYYWLYNNNGGGVCSFSNHATGGCTLGFDVTAASKNLRSTNGTSQSPTELAINIGGAAKFPIFSDTSTSIMPDGYLALGLKAGYIHLSGVNDTAPLFVPVLDANGNPIHFKNSLSIYDLSLTFVVTKQFNLSARLVGPIGGNDYLKRQSSVTLDSTF